MKIALLFLCAVYSISANAEYRAYKLKITDTATKKEREVITTMMPQAYIVYYPIRSSETVEIVDHWMCWKRSDGYQKPCTRPFASLEQSPKTGSPEVGTANIPN